MTHISKIALVVSLLLLAAVSVACSDTVEVEVTIFPEDRWVTGYVDDYETGFPVTGAEVLVECDECGELFWGYTDSSGYFEVYVGEWDDFDDVYFRVYSISAAGYYTYHADEVWYGITPGEEDIYTGVYLLDPLH